MQACAGEIAMILLDTDHLKIAATAIAQDALLLSASLRDLEQVSGPNVQDRQNLQGRITRFGRPEIDPATASTTTTWST